jgi:Putative beta-barrel porin 2
MKWCLVVAALFCPVSAFAQAATNDAGNVDQVRRDSQVHAGPFYLKPGLLVKEFGVDTNVFNSAGAAASDFTATVTPQTDIAVPFAHYGLFRATVGVDLVYFATYVSERSLDPQARVRAEAYAHRFTFFAEDAYLNTRQRPNYEIDLRSRHLENDLVGGVKVHLSSKLSAEVAARSAETRYDSDAFFDGTYLQYTLNRTTTGFVGDIRDQLTPLTSIGVRFDRLRDRFPYSPERDSRNFRVMPGIEFKPKALVSGSAWIGYRRFTPAEPQVLPAFSGLVADVGLSYTLLGATTFGASYHRDLTYSYEVDYPFFVDNSVGASIRRALGGRFDTILSADRHRYDYRDLLTANVVVPPGGRTDSTWVYGANVGYRFQPTVRVGFGASYYTRGSNSGAFVQYDGFRFGATVNYGI